MKRLKVFLWTVVFVVIAGSSYAVSMTLPPVYVSMSDSEFQSSVAGARGQIASIASQLQSVYGGSAGITLVDSKTARIWVTGPGVSVDELVINTGGGSSSGGGSSGGSAGQQIASQVIRQNVFQQAAPKKKTGEGKRTDVGADIYYRTGDQELIGINPSIAFESGSTTTLTVPIQRDTDAELTSVGLDVSEKWALGEIGNIGFHANVIGTFGGDDALVQFAIGPFVSFTVHLGDRVSISAGALVELNAGGAPGADEKYLDVNALVAPGANVGFQISDSMAINAFAIYYGNVYSTVIQDGEASDNFASFGDGNIDLGGEFKWSPGAWALSIGAKQITGVGDSDYSATEFYLGSTWMF